jgi:hypothetical protein
MGEYSIKDKVAIAGLSSQQRMIMQLVTRSGLERDILVFLTAQTNMATAGLPYHRDDAALARSRSHSMGNRDIGENESTVLEIKAHFLAYWCRCFKVRYRQD